MEQRDDRLRARVQGSVHTPKTLKNRMRSQSYIGTADGYLKGSNVFSDGKFLHLVVNLDLGFYAYSHS